MTASESIPAVWLRKFPPGYKLPLWRWILLPATTFMFHRNQGVWVSGNLQASAEGLDFAPTKMTASANKTAATWSLRWADIHEIDFTQGVAMDRIAIRHANGTYALQGARSSAFFERAKEALRNRNGAGQASS